MTKNQLISICCHFRRAIEKVRDGKGFYGQIKSQDRMSVFPNDCCDDTTDMLGYFLLHNFNVSTYRLTLWHNKSKTECHCVLLMDDRLTVIDLTGDQYLNDNRPRVYIGIKDEYYKNMPEKSICENYDFVAEHNKRLCFDYDAILGQLYRVSKK